MIVNRSLRSNLIILFLLIVSSVFLASDKGITLNNFQVQYLRRIKALDLTPEQERLKAILDDPEARIEDVKLIVGGILDDLLMIDKKYEELYKEKAEELLVKIHEEVKSGRRTRYPYGIWKGGKQGQGFINAVILVRNAIDESFGIKDLKELEEKLPPEKGWKKWLEVQKLGTPLGLFMANNLIREALAKELYPNKNEEPHLHEWKIIDNIDWHSPEGERVIKQAVPHILIDHMGLTLDETFIGKIKNWAKWAEENGLSGMLIQRFNNSGRLMLKFVFPEKFYDYQNPERPHVWHDWDFMIHDWDTEEGDKIASHWIRHKLFDPVHGEGWSIDGLADRVDSWDKWAKKDSKFWSMVERKFGSILSALKFGLREEFGSGKIRLGDFKIKYGFGVAELESPLVQLKKDNTGRVKKGIGNVDYSFGVDYIGYYVNKIAEDLGGLWKKIELDTEGSIYVLEKVFPLIDHPGPLHLYVNAISLLREPPKELSKFIEELREGRELPIPEDRALEILRDEFGIDISSLNHREKMNLILYLNINREGLEDYLRVTDPLGLKVLGNMTKFYIPAQLVGAFDEWRSSFMRYAQINERIEELSEAFGLNARGIREGEIDPAEIPDLGKYAPILLEEAVETKFSEMNNSILEKIYDTLNDTGISEQTKRRRIKELLTAQEKLSLLSEVLEALRKGEAENFIQTRLIRHDDGAEEYWFKFRTGSIEKQVRLVKRPFKSKEGDAGISLSIEPYSNEEIGFRIELGWDANRERNLVHINIDLRKFTNLLKHILPLAEEHELKLAEPEVFSWLVRMFY